MLTLAELEAVSGEVIARKHILGSAHNGRIRSCQWGGNSQETHSGSIVLTLTELEAVSGEVIARKHILGI